MIATNLDELKGAPHVDLRTIAWLIGYLLAWLFPLPAGAQSWNDASVKITNRNGQIVSVGSGTIIGANGEIGLVVTVKHLFRDGVGDIIVRRRDGHGYQGKLWAVDECADLAAIAIQDTGDLPQVQISIGQPRNAITAGFGAGFRVQEGRFKQASNAGDMFYTFHPTGGDSGGGVFTPKGSLAGVVWGEDGQSGATVGTDRLRRFLSHPAVLEAFTQPDEEPEGEQPPIVEIFTLR